jgi:hypothetical protein
MGEAAAHALFERRGHPGLPGRDILLDFASSNAIVAAP